MKIFMIVLFVFSMRAAFSSDLTIPVKMQNLEGKSVSFEDQSLIAFIAYSSKCPILRKYFPTLNNYSSAKKIKIYLLVSGRDSLSDLQNEKKNYKIIPEILIDPDYQFVKKLGLSVSSEAALVNLKTNEVIYRGAIDDGINFDAVKKPTQNYLLDAVNEFKSGHAPKIKSTKAFGCYLNL